MVDESPERIPRHVGQVYPYTLRGLIAAMEEARLRSFGDNPQLLLVREGDASWAVRRYEHEHETEVPG